MRSGGWVPQKRTTPAWMPKALSAFHSARRSPRGGGDGRRGDQRRALQQRHERALGQQLVHGGRAAQPVGGEALHAVVARQPAGEDGGPDGRPLRRPQRGQRAVGAAPHHLRERGQLPRASASRELAPGRGRRCRPGSRGAAGVTRLGRDGHRRGRRGRPRAAGPAAPPPPTPRPARPAPRRSRGRGRETAAASTPTATRTSAAAVRATAEPASGGQHLERASSGGS